MKTIKSIIRAGTFGMYSYLDEKGIHSADFRTADYPTDELLKAAIEGEAVPEVTGIPEEHPETPPVSTKPPETGTLPTPEETKSLDALKAEAKAMHVKGYGLMRTVKQLETAIEAKKAETK